MIIRMKGENRSFHTGIFKVRIKIRINSVFQENSIIAVAQKNNNNIGG